MSETGASAVAAPASAWAALARHPIGGPMQSLSCGSVAILGVPIDNVTMPQVLGAIETSIDEGGFHQIATANVDFLINSIHDLELKEILSACFLVLPDGMPLVWASRLMGASLRNG